MVAPRTAADQPTAQPPARQLQQPQHQPPSRKQPWASLESPDGTLFPSELPPQHTHLNPSLSLPPPEPHRRTATVSLDRPLRLWRRTRAWPNRLCPPPRAPCWPAELLSVLAGAYPFGTEWAGLRLIHHHQPSGHRGIFHPPALLRTEAPSTERPLARDPRVLIGWPLPLCFGLDGCCYW